MKVAIWISAFVLFANTVWSQLPPPKEVLLFQKLTDQVEAFKAKDIDRMVENVHKNFRWYYVTADTLLLEVEGKKAFRESMKGYFDSIELIDSQIVKWVVDGDRISFQERVTWKTSSGERSQTSMGIYQYKEGKIYRVWYFID